MLYKILSSLEDTYNDTHLKELEKAEALFRCHAFKSSDALRLGVKIAEAAVKYGEEPAVLLLRTSDGLPLFQYLGEGRTMRNLDFARKKANAAMLTGHCSLWALIHAAVHGGDLYGLEERDDCLPAGGAMPIYVQDSLYAVAAVSGLHKGLDHQIIVEGRCMELGQEIPVFHGQMI